MLSPPGVTYGAFSFLRVHPEFTMDITMPLRKGYDPNRAKGGKRANAGRTPDWLKGRCREAGPGIIEFLIKVATGGPMEQVVNAEGEVIGVPAAVKDRIKAAEVVLERGYGKVPQAITGEDGGPVTFKVVKYS